MSRLKIASNLSLPLETVTQTIGIIAKRRAGKSYTMRRIVEQLLQAKQQVVMVDPKGDLWGIRSASDGKAPGFSVVIIGGERGDVPLEVTSGEVVAKLVVEERVSVLLDLSVFRKHEVTTFMSAFMENLYRLKAKEIYRTPVMLVIDEADAIAPQKPQKGEERMLGAAEDIVRRGGQRGIGCILVTQRAAVLNKNVLTQVQILVSLRTIAPQDLDAMKAWIEVHGTTGQQKTLMESLPSLPVGDAWFWSPGWPTVDGIFQRVHVLPIETFDSGATPKPGERMVEPKAAAEVDLEVLKRQMQATIQRAKDNDPAELKKTIRRLEAEKKSRATQVDESSVARSMKRAVVEATKEFVQKIRQLEVVIARQQSTMKRAAETLIGSAVSVPKFVPAPQDIHRPAVVRTERRVAAARSTNVAVDESLTRPEQRILDALAWMESIGIDEPEQPAVSFLAGYRFGGGAFNNPRGALRTKGYVEYAGDRLKLTDSGRSLANAPEDALSNEALHEKVLSRLPSPESRLLRPLLEVYPESMSNEELAGASGYAVGSGGFNNPRGRLRTLGLIEYLAGGRVRAKDLLFPNR